MSQKFVWKMGLIAAALIMLLSSMLPRVAPAQTETAAPAYPPQQTYPQQSAPAYPQPAAAYPQSAPAYPQQPAYQQPPMQQMAPVAMPSQPNPIRQLFAGTIATLLNTTGLTLATTLTQGLTGAITGWFARKSGQAQAAQTYGGAQSYPQAYSPAPQPYPATPQSYPQTYPSSTATPSYPTTSGYPTSGYPSSAASPAYGSAASTSPYGAPSYTPAAATQVYDTQTGQVSGTAGTPYQAASTGYDGTLYAGIAYEVQAIGPNGAMTVNPASYVFRTGDRFTVSYRPSMPGRMEVYNINPAGQQTRIDAVNMAAGQLSTLGPYEFSNLTGDESLRLVLAPCSSAQLLVATRDIVNVSAAATNTSAVQLGSCGTATRALKVKTRDITKVAVDGGTSFALDPVSRQELSSGQVTAREVSIVFHHR